MSLLDLLMSRRPKCLENQQFALALTPDDVLTMMIPWYNNTMIPAITESSRDHYHRPWQRKTSVQDTGSVIQADRNNFQVNLDVQHFGSDEITVKVVDGFVIIEGRHDEKQDEHGWVSRHFTRRYAIPDNFDLDLIQSRLSSDGVLTITAPMKRRHELMERVVPIMVSGPIGIQERVGDGVSNDISIEHGH